ncbi:MAG: sulfite exporter TauE/SafE family protein [Candidatus Izimaplasma sp.]|nr:sulfite exporter TauE/SafE family protein [Candidatus Izimaplasma bacterium]
MEYIVYIIGGLMAGVATGLVGLSAATIIAPLFVTALRMNPYVAIGIALASDVFASALSATQYFRHKNIELFNAISLAITVVLFTIIASYFSRDTDPANLGGLVNIFVVFLGLRFLIFPLAGNTDNKLFHLSKSKIVQSLLWGAVIGTINGYFGAGGGLSMLAILTVVLGYDLKNGVGTSVFIMTFTAFVGAATHIILEGTYWVPLIITSISAMAGANLSSLYANKIDSSKLNKIIGTFLLVFGIVLVSVYFTQTH